MTLHVWTFMLMHERSINSLFFYVPKAKVKVKKNEEAFWIQFCVIKNKMIRLCCALWMVTLMASFMVFWAWLINKFYRAYFILFIYWAFLEIEHISSHNFINPIILKSTPFSCYTKSQTFNFDSFLVAPLFYFYNLEITNGFFMSEPFFLKGMLLLHKKM